ncbi:tetratricopeptide repeat protein [Actinoplanes sp. KI2]|uniref:tetratricopeptide repeat protein n=1 Tax=Actinoplanes sp. KI2 TaxID=2983315 RepID=UPI0021D5E413|nr:tetratricopeptide repeat protein [Actinoplanes sp. KI2]MCU7729192.1 tetratricopeptide repeat protein [Actinoplanes sp. KI2]
MPPSSPFSQARQQAQALAEGGNPDGARDVLERAIELGRADLAAGDRELLTTMQQLAALHRRAGDPAAARRLLEEAYEAGRRVGEADPVLVTVAYDLAVVAGELGNRYEAGKNYGRVAQFGPGVLGADHPMVDQARAYLAAEPEAAPAAPASSPPASPPASASSAPASAPSFPVTAPPMPLSPVVSAAPAPVPVEWTAPARRSRTPWVLGGLGAVVLIVLAVVGVVVLRPGGSSGDGTALGRPAGPGAATTAPTSAAITPAPTSAATTGPASAPGTTRIVTPADRSKVSWPFDARFTVSAADLAATSSDTVLAVSVCVAGICYLDGNIKFTDGVPDPYTIYLGDRKGGNHQAWVLRVDRISKVTYAKLVKDREAAFADGTWGARGTSMSDLNDHPVSRVTVIKSA